MSDKEIFKPQKILYKNLVFRSVLEARWATFFDIVNFKWKYEPEKYILAHNVVYVPDFWLSSLNCWIEIKGIKPTANEITKAVLLSKQYKKDVFILWGGFGYSKGDNHWRISAETIQKNYQWVETKEKNIILQQHGKIIKTIAEAYDECYSKKLLKLNEKAAKILAIKLNLNK